MSLGTLILETAKSISSKIVYCKNIGTFLNTFFVKDISFTKKNFSPEYDGYGGRRCSDLMKLVQKASTFDFALVIVGDNDVKSQSRQYICRKFKEFQQAIWPVDVRFAGHMRRKDLNPKLVSLNNMYYRNHLGPYLKSTRLIRREDFSNSCPYHFDVYGHGYRHLAVFVLSVVEEFINGL